MEVEEHSPLLPCEGGWVGRGQAGTEVDLGPVGLGDEGGGHGDKPGPCCGVVSATQKVDALGPRLEEKVQSSI